MQLQPAAFLHPPHLGKKRLDQALASVQALVDVEVQWHAYIIDPRTNPAGEEYLAYNRRRWGGDGWTQDLRRSGRPDGATFADWRWWPASLHAHRLGGLGGALPGPLVPLLGRPVYTAGSRPRCSPFQLEADRRVCCTADW